MSARLKKVLIERCNAAVWNKGKSAGREETLAENRAGHDISPEVIHGGEGLQLLAGASRTAFSGMTFTISDKVVKGTSWRGVRHSLKSGARRRIR